MNLGVKEDAEIRVGGEPKRSDAATFLPPPEKDDTLLKDGRLVRGDALDDADEECVKLRVLVGVADSENAPSSCTAVLGRAPRVSEVTRDLDIIEGTRDPILSNRERRASPPPAIAPARGRGLDESMSR
jgi:hypothetical protein